VIGEFQTSVSARRIELSADEQPLGDVIADAMLDGADRQLPASDLALLPIYVLGFDRLHYRDGHLPAGALSADSAGALILFDGPLIVMTLSGARLTSLLQDCYAKYPTPSPDFVQVSRGVRVELDPLSPARVVHIKLQDQPIVAQRRYRVVSVAPFWRAHDLSSKPEERTAATMREALTSFIAAHSPLRPTLNERIVRHSIAQGARALPSANPTHRFVNSARSINDNSALL
jgi:2',3'-cyclic-nucleotide 2'-phosphodiesterase (5'-nucleotidase family)